MARGKIERVELKGTILEEMRRCVLLQPLDEAAFTRVVDVAHAKKVPANVVLFEQGAALSNIYLIVSGAIKLQRLSPNGDEKVINILRPGQTFAEAALFSGHSKYPVTAVTVSPSIVIGIQALDYLRLIKDSSALGMNLLAKLSQQLHWMVEEVDRLTLHSATFRLVSYLLSHIPDDENERTGVTLLAPKHVIASRLSIKPETLSRTLKDLSMRGLIKTDGSQIELIEVDKLRQLLSIEI